MESVLLLSFRITVYIIGANLLETLFVLSFNHQNPQSGLIALTVTNVTAYRSLTGGLHYLTFSCLNIAYTIHQVSSHAHPAEAPPYRFQADSSLPPQLYRLRPSISTLLDF
jgi:hypothetical protein